MAAAMLPPPPPPPPPHSIAQAGQKLWDPPEETAEEEEVLHESYSRVAASVPHPTTDWKSAVVEPAVTVSSSSVAVPLLLGQSREGLNVPLLGASILLSSLANGFPLPLVNVAPSSVSRASTREPT